MLHMNEYSYEPNWHSKFEWTIYVGFVLAFLVAFGLGANDCANSYGTVVGAGVFKLWQAYVLATIFELLGAGLLGYKVSETFRKKILNVDIYSFEKEINQQDAVFYGYANATNVTFTKAEFLLGELAALAATGTWLLFATVFLLPVSTTHSAVGASVGFSLVLKGIDGVAWKQILNIVFSWIISPLVSGIVSACFYTIIRLSVLLREDPFEASLNMLPIFYFFTISINMFSVLFSGSKYLHFDKLTWWQVLVISLGLGIVIGLIMLIWGKNFIRNRVLAIAEEELLRTPDDVVLRRDMESFKSPKSTPSSSLSSKNMKLSPSSRNKTDQRKSSKNLQETKKLAGNADKTTQDKGKSSQQKTSFFTKLKKKYLKTDKHEHPLTSQVFHYLQIMSACFLSFSHGTNDTANAVGPLVAIWTTWKTGHALTETPGDMSEQFLLMFGAISMIVGLWVLGHKVIRTIGTKITHVTSTSGFAMEIGTAFTVLVCSKIGLPVSTTHCAVGAVICVGWVKSSDSGVSWKTFGNIVGAWVLTLPVTCGLSALITVILEAF